MGHGGARPGAGRKPKSSEERWLAGNAGKLSDEPKDRPKRQAAVRLMPAPADLPDDQAEVWNRLAPHACAARTLTDGTAAAFADLCEAIVLKRQLKKEIDEVGLTFLKVTVDGAGEEHRERKANPLLTQHRGMMQRVEAGLLRFRLSPMGKELEIPEETKDEWAEFDSGPVQ